MKEGFKIPQLGLIAKIGDVLMTPLMYLVSGTFREKPQRTHRWNYKPLEKTELDLLKKSKMVFEKGIIGEVSLKWPLLFHIPIFGGWRKYVVLVPKKNTSWYVGWQKEEDSGISLIKISGAVRMLIGSENVFFFGISAKSKEQIAIKEIGKGVVGKRGPYCNTLLL
jgi:hypothetical protein